MPRTIEKTVYKFEELDEDAKECARDSYRGFSDSSDFESTIEDAQRMGEMLGIEFATRTVKLCGGGTRQEPKIWWNLSASQGDGACFEGDYSYKKGALAAIRKEAPEDNELHRIARELQNIQARHFYRLSATMEHRGHYYHSGCMVVCMTHDCAAWNASQENASKTITQLMRDFADWIYSQLQGEDDYINSNEYVDDAIISNEYDFTEVGEFYP